jgi:hypothetical protein
MIDDFVLQNISGEQNALQYINFTWVCCNTKTIPFSHPLIDMFSTKPEQVKSHLCFYMIFLRQLIYSNKLTSIIHYGSCPAA